MGNIHHIYWDKSLIHLVYKELLRITKKKNKKPNRNNSLQKKEI